jgi:hypothetical protein
MMNAKDAGGLGNRPNRCPECGSAFVCGMDAGLAECWCARLPPLLPVPAAAPAPLETSDAKTGCLCPICLQRKLDAASSPVLRPQA